MPKPGSMFSVGINAFLSLVWLTSILISIFKGGFSSVFWAAWISFICFFGATIINFSMFRNNNKGYYIKG